MDTVVRQTTYDEYDDGDGGNVRLNRRGEIVVADQFQQYVLDGRCFIASQTVQETADLLGHDAYNSLVGSIALDVPSGVTVIPLEIMLAQAGTVSGGENIVLFTLDDKVRITSGIAVTPRNYLINATWERGTMCTVKSHKEGTTDLVVAANAEDNTFYARVTLEDLEGGDAQNVFWTARKNPAPEIKGPASLVIYTYSETGAEPSWFWHMIWAEFLTGERVP